MVMPERRLVMLVMVVSLVLMVEFCHGWDIDGDELWDKTKDAAGEVKDKTKDAAGQVKDKTGEAVGGAKDWADKNI
ncbi:hypothetical protein LINPERHAP2_LOCUS1088 [Linum perenne]